MVAAGILLFIQGIAQIMRCILCMRDNQWLEAEEEVRETEDELVRAATKAETAGRP
jgi:TRAP-type mannitol/chloroaromatic compound transport system permease small subunit